ncbi:transcription factor E2F7 isoform X1 [Rana temporaria]|uniref:transcription factor E2F7 isoform X1 n=2 Tax=Rana temporaria TaxID=8407 RepID=UPI001AADD143|nr:transcription factor E2F7 isoform X1 [Rana temporaria]
MVRDTDMEIHGCLTLKDLATSRRSKGEQDREDRTAHKENMYDRYRISPRIPLKGEPIDLSKQRGLTPEKFPITPVKMLDRPLADPWTPTANLKMLISVASPEIRDREKKKELFRPIENEPEDIEPDAQQFEAVDDIDDLEKRPSRKQKSLGLLCQKFLARYPSYPLSTEKTTISLDEAASSLGVERRRIYDIVNVLESLHLVSRVAKNQYCWHGQHSLNDTLKNLQREGERQNYGAQIASFQHKDFMTEPKKHCFLLNQGALSLQFSEADCPSASASSRKDKSLRIMSQKFVMLFLVSTTKIITLEIAAKILIEESQDISDHSKFKTKVRRLYDIANVLTSLGLIKKVHVTEERGRKPAFKWIGPTDFKTEGDQRMEVTTTTPSPDSKREGCNATADSNRQRLLRHSSFNHIQAINTVKRKVCSEPSSPHKCQKVSVENVDTSSSKMAHLAAICRQQIENDCRTQRATTDKLSNGNLGPVPFSVVVPVNSEYSVRHHVDQENSIAPNDMSALKFIAPSNLDQSCHGFLPNQPYMYVPSASVLMLCGNHPGGKGLDTHHREGSTPPILDLGNMSESNQPVIRQRTDSSDEAPLSLVKPKCIWAPQTPSFYETSIQHKSPDRVGEEKHIDSNHTVQNAFEPNCIQRVLNTKDETLQAAPPQYLYVPSAAGLNGFNFFLPASQATGAMGLSQNNLQQVNVPYVMVPSTALSGLPFLCSSALANQISAVSSGSAISSGSMSYSLPGVPSSHIMFGASPVVSPQQCETSLEPTPALSPVCASPVPEKLASSTAADSPVCVVQPVPIKQNQPPLTPKSIRPVHKDTFFKTPGSLGVSPALQKNERSLARNSSSAQRRLDICSSSDD